ncbi:MAG TPA: HNH endonuclease [Anaerolineaceae bacterium]|nr:HNH endonuclease [Anaerolineaceae bacterium]
MLNAYIGITDKLWFRTLSMQPGIDEVNFWLPSGRSFKALNPGELFLFKLHYPEHFIVGGGIFAHFTVLPVSLAWEAFEIKNGATSLRELRERISRYRKIPTDPHEDYKIGCILLEQPFFLPEKKWIAAPPDWPKSAVTGKILDLSVEPARSILQQLHLLQDSPHLIQEAPARYGSPTLVLPRLGQGSFRVLVTDAYGRSCAISNERTLPVLDAAHIKPFSEAGENRITNGILLRKDLHTLFDKGYITITPDLVIEVSKKIREEFENGRDYYKFHGQGMRPPKDWTDRPSRESLAWHNEHMYRG